MAFYKVQHRYRSDVWPEPLEAGRIIDITADQADTLNRDSPGVVAPVDLIERPPKADVKVDDLPDHKPADKAEPEPPVKRGPGRPPKAAAPYVPKRDR